jgi:hypothetical protein
MMLCLKVDTGTEVVAACDVPLMTTQCARSGRMAKGSGRRGRWFERRYSLSGGQLPSPVCSAFAVYVAILSPNWVLVNMGDVRGGDWRAGAG